MKRVLSGIQPSGDLHLGNYFGALRQWVAMQEDHECFYMLANEHSLTSLRDAEELRRLTYEATITSLACGLDPEESVIFKQSDVPAHTELTWVLATVTPMGLLERATSYKDKISKGIAPNAGLFIYPILQAADILLYSPESVPVGKDQKQHIEMTRDIAEKFNHIYGEAFVLPEPFIPEEVAIVPGTDGQKMSKSYNNTIPLFADEATLKKKIMGIVTDSAGVEDKKDPEGNTIYALMKLVAPDQAEEMAVQLSAGGYGYGEAKKELLAAVISFLKPIWEKRKEIESKKGYVEEVLVEGAKKAQAEANQIMEKVRGLVGI